MINVYTMKVLYAFSELRVNEDVIGSFATGQNASRIYWTGCCM